MKVDVVGIHPELSPKQERRLRKRIRSLVGRVRRRVGRVIVRLHTHSDECLGSKVTCRIDASMGELGRVIVEQQAPDLNEVIELAGGELREAVTQRLAEVGERNRRSARQRPNLFQRFLSGRRRWRTA